MPLLNEVCMLDELFRNNLAWAERIKAEDPDFFEKLAHQQTPNFSG
jgi:carbonic anhydrase